MEHRVIYPSARISRTMACSFSYR